MKRALAGASLLLVLLAFDELSVALDLVALEKAGESLKRGLDKLLHRN